MTVKTRVKFSSIIAFFLALTFIGCNNKPAVLSPAEKLSNLQQQVENDIAAVQDFETNDFAQLKAAFINLDSSLSSVNPSDVQAYFDKLNLAQAYLQQYMEVGSSLKYKLDYSKKQLTDLKYDLDNGFVNDSLFNVYFERETIAADTLHNQIIYFKDRFDSCQKELKALK